MGRGSRMTAMPAGAGATREPHRAAASAGRRSGAAWSGAPRWARTWSGTRGRRRSMRSRATSPQVRIWSPAPSATAWTWTPGGIDSVEVRGGAGAAPNVNGASSRERTFLPSFWGQRSVGWEKGTLVLERYVHVPPSGRTPGRCAHSQPPRPGSLVPRAPSSPRVARSAPRNPGPITRALPDADHCARIRDASAAVEQGRAVGGSREERPDRWRRLKNTFQHA